MILNVDSLFRAGVKLDDYLKKIERSPKAPEWRKALETFRPEARTVEGLSKIEGKATIISFSAGWCKDCIKHVPALAKTLQKASNKNIRLVMLDYDGNKKLAEEAGVKAIPTLIVFGSKGTEIGRIIEHPSGTFKSIEEEVLAKLVAEK